MVWSTFAEHERSKARDQKESTMNHLFEISFGLAMTAIVGFAVRGAPVGGSASVTLREMDSPWKRFYLTLTLLGVPLRPRRQRVGKSRNGAQHLDLSPENEAFVVDTGIMRIDSATSCGTWKGNLGRPWQDDSRGVVPLAMGREAEEDGMMYST